ncbi:MAG: hypothetical protein K0S31_2008 [Sphingobacterium multivorum]|nr:hypothetical protein [Sphingobacterium multivorum]
MYLCKNILYNTDSVPRKGVLWCNNKLNCINIVILASNKVSSNQMRYKLYREQQLTCDMDTAWAFFSSPMNLSEITPKDMGFVVTSDCDQQEIFEGMIIDYLVSPILWFPLKWKTKITQVEKNKSFTDFQLKGPYAYWNHFHEFIPNENGVLMKDRVDYELPLGILGTIAHGIFVKRKLERIFDYRHQVLEKLFNQTQN